MGPLSHVPRVLRARSLTRLGKFAHDEGHWHRWATAAVLGWTPHPETERLQILRIHSATDHTFPLRYVHADVVIANGGHVLPLTHAAEVSEFLSAGMARFDQERHHGSI